MRRAPSRAISQLSPLPPPSLTSAVRPNQPTRNGHLSPMPLASSPPASKSPKQTPPSHLPERACGVLTGDGSRQRRRSLDQSFGRRLFGDETNSVSPKEEYSVSDCSNLIEKRFVQDGGRSQWTFLEAEGVDDQVSDNVAGQAYHPRLREPRIRLHITRAERMWHTLFVRALRAASQQQLMVTPCRVLPAPFAFPLVRACAARAAPGGMETR